MGRYVIYEQSEGGPPEEIDEAPDDEEARAMVHERMREFQAERLIPGSRGNWRYMCWWQYEEDETEAEDLDEEE